MGVELNFQHKQQFHKQAGQTRAPVLAEVTPQSWIPEAPLMFEEVQPAHPTQVAKFVMKNHIFVVAAAPPAFCCLQGGHRQMGPCACMMRQI